MTAANPTMTIDQALAHPGELLAVWDLSGKEEYLFVYAHSNGKLERLAASTMSSAQRQDRTAELARRGIRIGASDMPGPFVWSTDRNLSVWSLIPPVGVVAEGHADRIKASGGAQVRRADVERVVSFLDDDSLGHRGVKVVTRSGVEIVIVEEDAVAARLDPTYGIDHVMVEGAWATFLGRDLAAWLGVPHTDELP